MYPSPSIFVTSRNLVLVWPILQIPKILRKLAQRTPHRRFELPRLTKTILVIHTSDPLCRDLEASKLRWPARWRGPSSPNRDLEQAGAEPLCRDRVLKQHSLPFSPGSGFPLYRGRTFLLLPLSLCRGLVLLWSLLCGRCGWGRCYRCIVVVVFVAVVVAVAVVDCG